MLSTAVSRTVWKTSAPNRFALTPARAATRENSPTWPIASPARIELRSGSPSTSVAIAPMTGLMSSIPSVSMAIRSGFASRYWMSRSMPMEMKNRLMKTSRKGSMTETA